MPARLLLYRLYTFIEQSINPNGEVTGSAARVRRPVAKGVGILKVAKSLGIGTGTVLTGSPADFGKFIADEIDKWGKVVKFAGVKAD